ncbi:MAG: PTS sugar transporter subunit IIA [Erysipelotrichaceae bacterium]|nr:PTS sugar transporter subunit IIA [Erysipelotrichaceae bacterium]MDY6034857.1 PTS sugar transporter subunit IIA [Bulleidia sp.]
MIGIVVTGHGHFATGLSSSVELIGGKPEHYEAVDFVQEDSTEDLEKHLTEAFAKLKDCEDGILVFSDLVGGSPFKVSVELSMKLKDQYKIVVLSGTNLGMLVEANLTRGFASDIDSLANATVETGKSQVMRYEFVQHEEVSSDEGI